MLFDLLNRLKYATNKKLLSMRYGSGVSEIDIVGKHVSLTIGGKYKKNIPISNVIELIYNIDNSGYFFRVKTDGEKVGQFFFDRKYDIRYRPKDLKGFVNKVKELSISNTPDFGQYGAIYECQLGGIVQYCTANNKYLLTITKDQKNNVCLNHGTFDKSKCKIVNLSNLDIEKEITDYGNTSPTKEVFGVSSGFYIIDKSLTFNRGYCVVSVDLSGCKNTPMVFGDKIFYSFDQKEIIDKIKELFDRYK